MSNDNTKSNQTKSTDTTPETSLKTPKKITSDDLGKTQKENAVKHRVILEGSIRRKKGMTGLPGLEEGERRYKLGDSLDKRTGKPLKGISNELEKIIMPSVIGMSASDPKFSATVSTYWSNISVLIPQDEEYQKDHQKGKLLKIECIVTGSFLKEKIEKADSLQDKIKIVQDGIVEGQIQMSEESYPDFILASYALKSSSVARTLADVEKSPKIYFYLYNKQRAIQNSLDIIKLREKAVDLFKTIQNDDKTLDAILIMFDVRPTDFPTTMEKVIEVDTQYTKNKESIKKFISFATDKNLETKYLLKKAVNMGKLTNPSNTETYYYNDVLLGSTLQEAVATINSDISEYKLIKQTLIRETKLN